MRIPCSHGPDAEHCGECMNAQERWNQLPPKDKFSLLSSDSEQELCRHGNPDDRCDTCAELIFDRWIQDFYGADTPQTLKEELEVAAAQKRIIG